MKKQGFRLIIMTLILLVGLSGLVTAQEPTLLTDVLGTTGDLVPSEARYWRLLDCPAAVKLNSARRFMGTYL
jgi:hypothetical protein